MVVGNPDDQPSPAGTVDHAHRLAGEVARRLVVLTLALQHLSVTSPAWLQVRRRWSCSPLGVPHLPETAHMTRTPHWLTVLAVIAVVVLLTGVSLYIWGVRTATFGWFAYAPHSDDAFVPQVAPGLARQRAGEVLVAVGLVAVGFVAGVLVERRRPTPRPSSAT